MPRDIKPSMMRNLTSKEVYERDFERARSEGKAEGLLEVRKEAIGWLQEKYMLVDRTTPEAKALLQVTRDFSRFLQVKAGA